MRCFREANKVTSALAMLKVVVVWSALALIGAIPSAALVEKRNDLAGKQKILHEVFEEAGTDMDFDKVKSLGDGDTASKIDKVKAMNAELVSLADEVKALDEVDGIAATTAKRQKELTESRGIQHPAPGGPDEKQGEPQSLGKLYIASAGYKAFIGDEVPRQKGVESLVDFDIKTVFRTGAGWATEAVRLPRVELDPQRPIAVVDMIPGIGTGLDTIRYMEETTFTNNAVETAESTATTASDLIGEAALALTERTQPVEWLPVFLPMTQQQMEDVEGAEDYVNQRLTYMLRARLDLQILRGDGVTPNVLGTNNVTGINTQAKGTDPTPDAIYKGLDLCRTVGFADPSVIFLHPNDWQDIRLLRTADGIYILGSPTDNGPARLWGLPVVQSTAVLENTGTVGDYRNFAALYTKRGITMSASDSHAHYFTRGMLAIRADMRVAVVHFRPEAFSTITGI